MKVEVDLVGGDGDDLKISDITGHIQALQKVIDGKVLTVYDSIRLHSVKSIMKGIEKELENLKE